VTADGGFRRGASFALKEAVDEACQGTPCVEAVVVAKRTGQPVEMKHGRDHWWEALMATASAHCPPAKLDAEHPLFILYTSGTTGKPKGVLHTTGGYLVHVAATAKAIFDLKETDTFWCTADIGWVTGHSYVVYGPLANGATCLMYEGAPDTPARDRFWDLIERHGVTILYTAPTAIRAFMKWGTEWPEKHDLSSLRLLGTVGEPINPEAWIWYQKHIGKGRCPIVDTWWQTETGMILITPLPGITKTRPGSATVPFPGVEAKILSLEGKEVKVGGGYLAITRPWPAMLRTIWGDDPRYVETYWSKWGSDVYFPGDGAKRDKNGNFWLLGRVDDVMNVAGHRIGTMEVESALVDHPAVAEAAVVGVTDEIKGTAIAAFVILKEKGRAAGASPGDGLQRELQNHVVKKIGAIARPDKLFFTAELPKTRSGKIMRRLLRDIAEGRVLGDTTTLADPAVVASLKTQYEEKES
jgi:acetyl-CoA synthetase